MKKTLFIILIFNLACREKTRYFDILIPLDYKGKVILNYNQQNSNNKLFKFRDDYFLLKINAKEPPNVKIFDAPRPGGPYEIRAFYYNSDTIYQIHTVSSANNKSSKINMQITANGFSTIGNFGIVETFIVDSLKIK